MSFVNPNFRNEQKKQVVKEKESSNNIEMLDVNFNNVKLEGEPRRYDIPNNEENIMSLESIMEEKQGVSRFEYISSPNVANLTGVPKVEEINTSEVAKIQIGYLDKISKTMTM